MIRVDALRQVLLRLPLTNEQWEPDMAAVLRHDGPRLAAIARLAVRASEGPTLDLGIGYGYSSAALRVAGRKWIVGVEHPSRDLVRSPVWRRLVAELGLSPLLADVCSLPLRDASFSLVCAAEILEHVPPHRCQAFLRECRRVCAAGGLFVVTTPNFTRLANRLALLRGKSPLDLPVPRFGDTFGHLREYTEAELRALLESARFEVLQVACVSGHPAGSAFSPPSWVSALEWLLPHIGMARMAKHLVAGAVAG